MPDYEALIDQWLSDRRRETAVMLTKSAIVQADESDGAAEG